MNLLDKSPTAAVEVTFRNLELHAPFDSTENSWPSEFSREVRVPFMPGPEVNNDRFDKTGKPNNTAEAIRSPLTSY